MDKLIHVAIFACLLILTTCSNKQNLMTKFSYYFATRSYSIYLFAPYPTCHNELYQSDSNVLVFTAVSLAITCVLSELLYRLVEVKFMNMREVFRLSQSRFTYYASKANSVFVISIPNTLTIWWFSNSLAILLPIIFAERKFIHK